MYQERRFTKLGSFAAALLQALPLYEILLQDSPTENLLAQACRLYVQCEVFITELHLLAYFNKHVTFPFLYCVEISDIPSLKTILPKLHADLLNCDISTLKNFVIERKNVNVDNLNTELEMKMLNLLCYSAAACIQ